MGDTWALRWIHSDDRGIGPAVVAGYARAKNGPWSAADEATRADFRALLVGVIATMALAGPVPPVVEGKQIIVSVHPSSRDDDFLWQRSLARGISAFIGGSKPDLPFGSYTVTTKGGTKGVVTPNAAFLWVEAVVVLGIVGIVAAYNYLIVSQDNELESLRIASDHKKQELAAELAAAAEVVEKHKIEEAKRGLSLPYSEGELAQMSSLDKAVERTTGWAPPPMKTTPDITGITEAIPGAIKQATPDTTLIFLALGALYLLK